MEFGNLMLIAQQAVSSETTDGGPIIRMFLRAIASPFGMVVAIVMVSCAASVIGKIAVQARKVAVHRQETSLKRELIDRGLSVDEVERVVRASADKADNSRPGCGDS